MQTVPFPMLFFVFVIGLLIGSFLNVCIYRIPLELTVVKGRSMCPNCGKVIPWYLNIPLFSFLILKGRCRNCNAGISPVYPLVEALNAIFYLATFLLYGLTPTSLLLSLLFSVLIVISFIDLRHRIIPNGLVLILVILGLMFACYQVFVLDMPWSLYAIGFLAASLPLFLLGMLFRDGIGGGDIKLMAAAGLFLGWKLILLALFLAALSGLLYAGVLLILRRAGRRTEIPFGPFLSIGLIVSSLFGHQLIHLYLSAWLIL